jgi:4,5-dihydroxyphthalate decarboxylase
MAITTHLVAREFGKPFTAIPVFPVRQFHHATISVNTRSGVQSPKDLEGKRVGVRAYTVTGGVWSRGILATQYGVDLTKVTWVIFDEEHVAEYKPPSNVESAGAGANLGAMLASGELAAAIGAGNVDSPDVKPLIADAANVQNEWCRQTGVYPINHTVVIKDELVQSNPGLARDVFAAFDQAKQQFLKKLQSGEPLSPEEEALARRRSLLGDDVMPYGTGAEVNRKALDMIVQFALDQKILSRQPSWKEIFVPGL